jgi:hypothetical protein
MSTASLCDLMNLPTDATALSLQWPYDFYFSAPLGILAALIKWFK